VRFCVEEYYYLFFEVVLYLIRKLSKKILQLKGFFTASIFPTVSSVLLFIVLDGIAIIVFYTISF